MRMRAWVPTAIALLLLTLGCGSASEPSSARALTPAELQPLRQAAASYRAYRQRTNAAGPNVATPALVGESFVDAVRSVHRAGLRQRASMFPGTLPIRASAAAACA